MGELQRKFQEEIVPKLQKSLGIKNPMAVPRVVKVVINMGVKDALSDKKSVEKAGEIIAQITGQKPKITAAKKSIASFKLREGDKIGVVVTLRGKRMYDFLTKIISVTLPRLRDFRGMRKTSFDRHGNYTLGFSEYAMFPEIDPGKIEKVQGLEVNIVTSAKNDAEGIALLQSLGMPFERERKRQGGLH